jgi:hypothetical protein
MVTTASITKDEERVFECPYMLSPGAMEGWRRDAGKSVEIVLPPHPSRFCDLLAYEVSKKSAEELWPDIHRSIALCQHMLDLD